MRGYPVFRVPTEAPGPPRERVQTRRWGQLELKIWERPTSTLRNVDGGGGPPGGEDVDGGAATTDVEDIDGGLPGGAGDSSDSGHHRC
jgi:hypothetical protein